MNTRRHMSNMRKTSKLDFGWISNDQTKKLMFLKFDLDYAYGHMKLSEETGRQCVFAITGRSFSIYYQFKKDTTDWQINFKKNWPIIRLMYTSIVRWRNSCDTGRQRRAREETIQRTGKIRSRRQASENQNIMNWLRDKIDENGNKPNEENGRAVLGLNHPEN